MWDLGVAVAAVVAAAAVAAVAAATVAAVAAATISLNGTKVWLTSRWLSTLQMFVRWFGKYEVDKICFKETIYSIVTLIFVLAVSFTAFTRLFFFIQYKYMSPTIPSETPTHRKVTVGWDQTGGIQYYSHTLLFSKCLLKTQVAFSFFRQTLPPVDGSG